MGHSVRVDCAHLHHRASGSSTGQQRRSRQQGAHLVPQNLRKLSLSQAAKALLLLARIAAAASLLLPRLLLLCVVGLVVANLQAGRAGNSRAHRAWQGRRGAGRGAPNTSIVTQLQAAACNRSHRKVLGDDRIGFHRVC